jgi:hypothetical protein
VRARHRISTRDTYTSAANTYITFCKLISINPYKKISEEILCHLCWCWCHKNSVNTLASWVSGVQAFYRGLGHGDLPRGFYYQSTRAVRNIYGKVDITMS